MLKWKRENREHLSVTYFTGGCVVCTVLWDYLNSSWVMHIFKISNKSEPCILLFYWQETDEVGYKAQMKSLFLISCCGFLYSQAGKFLLFDLLQSCVPRIFGINRGKSNNLSYSVAIEDCIQHGHLFWVWTLGRKPSSQLMGFKILS